MINFLDLQGFNGTPGRQPESSAVPMATLTTPVTAIADAFRGDPEILDIRVSASQGVADILVIARSAPDDELARRVHLVASDATRRWPGFPFRVVLDSGTKGPASR